MVMCLYHVTIYNVTLKKLCAFESIVSSTKLNHDCVLFVGIVGIFPEKVTTQKTSPIGTSQLTLAFIVSLLFRTSARACVDVLVANTSQCL